MFASSADAVTFPIGRNASGVDPHFGIGEFSEQPIEDEEFDEPQNAEGRDVRPDDKDGSSQMVQDGEYRRSCAPTKPRTKRRGCPILTSPKMGAALARYGIVPPFPTPTGG